MTGNGVSGSAPISRPAKQPQAIVPPHTWQAAESTGDWTLVGCTVAPGFDFATFEMAPKDWEPALRRTGVSRRCRANAQPDDRLRDTHQLHTCGE